MNIKIISVGKIKEKYLRDGIDEYAKRLSRYCKLSFIQVPDEKTPDGASEAEESSIRNVEGERILRHIKEVDYVISLAIEGKMLNSVELSRHIEQLGIRGISNISFVIGGSLGLSSNVLKKSNEQLSFSPMTFPHQLFRIMLTEQIYRAFTILNHQTYHK